MRRSLPLLTFEFVLIIYLSRFEFSFPSAGRVCGLKGSIRLPPVHALHFGLADRVSTPAPRRHSTTLSCPRCSFTLDFPTLCPSFGTGRTSVRCKTTLESRAVFPLLFRHTQGMHDHEYIRQQERLRHQDPIATQGVLYSIILEEARHPTLCNHDDKIVLHPT